MMHDAGLFFICYQRDPREGSIKIYENIAKLDALNQFTTHTGSNLFASAGRIGEDESVRAESAPIR
jgi:deferrochelatase/peroxidase EfeB